MRFRSIFLIFLGVIFVWFLFLERAILPPFIVAAVFAYILTPVVNFFSFKFKFPRTVSILITYVLLLLPLVVIGILLSRTIGLESLDINSFFATLLENAKKDAIILPDWIRPVAQDLLVSLEKSRFVRFIEAPNFAFFFSQAISRVISLFIFIFSSFYFLKDGHKFAEKTLTLVPGKYKADVEILLKKINLVLAGYLRGEIFLIIFVAAALYLALLIVGVRFALTLAIFSGFAEIVPVIGPITAGTIAVGVVLLTGTANFGLSPVYAALIVAIIYFIFRQFEDYLVIPVVMEKITKLPPFVIFFAVIAGGHLAGILGLILAVPLTAVLRLLFEFFMEKMKDPGRE